jgi:hypothetical protein
MDDETADYLKDRKGVNWFRVNIAIPESQKNTHPANRCMACMCVRSCMLNGYSIAALAHADMCMWENCKELVHTHARTLT